MPLNQQKLAAVIRLLVGGLLVAGLVGILVRTLSAVLVGILIGALSLISIVVHFLFTSLLSLLSAIMDIIFVGRAKNQLNGNKIFSIFLKNTIYILLFLC